MVPAKSSAEMELILLPRYCGVVTVSANALDIWDLLGIFCRHVRELGSQKTVLLPSNLSMRLDTVRLKTDMISLLEQEEQKGLRKYSAGCISDSPLSGGRTSAVCALEADGQDG